MVQRDAAALAAKGPKSTPPASLPFGHTLAAAQAGDAIAQFRLAVMYEHGSGVAPSPAAAVTWYKRCAAQAAWPREVWLNLGNAYLFGRGVQKDEAEGVRLLRIGADTGDPVAQYTLAHCLSKAMGVPAPDFSGAAALHAAAAAQDYAPSIVSLGFAYASGRGVARDVPRAVALYERALAHPAIEPGVAADAASALGRIYLDGEGGVARDVARGIAYVRRAVALGSEPAAWLLREALRMAGQT